MFVETNTRCSEEKLVLGSDREKKNSVIFVKIYPSHNLYKRLKRIRFEKSFRHLESFVFLSDPGNTILHTLTSWWEYIS